MTNSVVHGWPSLTCSGGDLRTHTKRLKTLQWTSREEEDIMGERIHPPMHPGRVLELEFLKPLKITPYALAKAIGVDAPRV
jgi:hypothetical protein